MSSTAPPGAGRAPDAGSGAETPAVDARAFRDAMGLFPSGVTVIAADDGVERHAMTAASFTSVSLDPPLVLICVGLNARLTPLIRRAGGFAVHVLTEEQGALATLCAAGPAEERVERLTRVPGRPPRVEPFLARLECRLHAEHPGGDHAIFLGAPILIETADAPDRTPPLLWWRSALRGWRGAPIA